jgi:hypothetical protein
MESLRTMAESQGDVAWAVTEIERLRAENERLRDYGEILRRYAIVRPVDGWEHTVKAAFDALAPPDKDGT